MVRSGARPGQVLSSGRHTGPAKLTSGKKGTHLKKISRLNADSGFPIHSDSESQTEAVQGLEGCASLLRDILRNEDSGTETAYSENRYNSGTLEGKRYGSKKKGQERHKTPLVRKELLSSDNKKQISNEASAESERDTSEIAQNWSLQDHYRSYSPMIYHALCEHVQTQMSLMNNSTAKNSANGIPAAPCHTVSDSESQATSQSNYGLCIPTPVWSAQQPSCPSMVHAEVQTGGDNQFASQSETVSVNPPGIPANSVNASPVLPCGLPGADRSAVAALQQLGLMNGILPQKGVPREADLLKCFQTYMSLFQSPGKEAHADNQTSRSSTRSQQSCSAANEDRDARTQMGEATSEGRDLNIHVSDAKIIKDVQKAKNVNQTAEKVRTMKYLLGELKALLAEQEDSEIERLIAEVEACISELPAISGSTNIQVEVALAMQPLRSENAHLRRQVRILNQRLREQEKTQKATGAVDYNLELFSLQSLNISLQNQLQESLKNQELLQNKNEELLKVIENQKDENKKYTSIFKDKDQTILENKQQFDIEITKIKIELEEALVDVKSSRFKLEAAEKENQILGITLRQRDAEVTRLRDLTRTLQNSMAKLLSDLSVDSTRYKSGNNLTKSLLNIYDKQLQHDPAPAHTSIMSYLNKLETNHSFAHLEAQSTVQNEEAIGPDGPSESVVPSRGPHPNNTRGRGEAPAPGIVSTFLKQDSDAEDETMTLIEDGCNLDSTVYIPLVRSTSKVKSPLSKKISPQPQRSLSTTQLVSSRGLVSEAEKKLCTSAVCSLRQEVEDAPEKLSRTADMEDKQLLEKIKEAIGKIPVARVDPEVQAACHGPSACHESRVQVKGSTACEGSILNSDLMSDWSISSFSTFTSHDEQDFRNGLAALDANIARLQSSLRSGLLEK
ncbi:coiled-coil domain-containing protein 14 [Ochotona princeps]|uniref:coiled-coil domain-containing protein 14 n=1 Tax=Ochotona princeps TaxID=9978 RepID=UPI0027148F65|nr:coiled-coil domain-containing protein 14 [Ochotona princeps]